MTFLLLLLRLSHVLQVHTVPAAQLFIYCVSLDIIRTQQDRHHVKFALQALTVQQADSLHLFLAPLVLRIIIVR